MKRRHTVQEIKEYIREVLTELRGQEDVAAHFRISLDTMRKRFRQEAGVTLARFIRLVRVDRMKQLLLETDYTCQEIIWHAGFMRDDTGYKVFRALVGVTMLEYRKQCPDQIMPAAPGLSPVSQGAQQPGRPVACEGQRNDGAPEQHAPVSRASDSSIAWRASK